MNFKVPSSTEVLGFHGAFFSPEIADGIEANKVIWRWMPWGQGFWEAEFIVA